MFCKLNWIKFAQYICIHGIWNFRANFIDEIDNPVDDNCGTSEVLFKPEDVFPIMWEAKYTHDYSTYRKIAKTVQALSIFCS